MAKKVLFILAHPYLNRSIANKVITDHVKSLYHVTYHDLYETYPYFNINVKKEQELLLEHDLIVFQHPFYWYNMPPLLKLWEDEVLELGFAYGEKGNALRGKDFLLSITTGNSSETYAPDGANKYAVHSFLYSYETLCHLCGLKWHAPLVLHWSRSNGDEDTLRHAERLKTMLLNYVDKGHL